MAKIIPQALRKGDTIALVSPSARINGLVAARMQRAQQSLGALGYKVKIFYTENLSENFPEAVQQRCEELHSAFRDADVKAIMSTIGGISSNELLRHLDYDLIRSNPKIFVGYSDITLLHHALYTKADLRTFYGPAAITQFGEFPEPIKFTTDHFQHILHDGHAITAENSSLVPQSTEWTQEFLDWMKGDDGKRARTLSPGSTAPRKWLRKGSATGRLYGGCLPSLLQLCGTPYQVDFRGRILVIETPEGFAVDSAWPLEHARSNLADMVNAGILDEVAGLVVGRGYQHDEKMQGEWEKIVLEQCHATKFPILANVDTGHTDPLLTLPLDALVSLDSGKDEFRILEAVVTAPK